jgi:hypothetical protein
VPVGARAHSLSQLARLGAVGIQELLGARRGEGTYGARQQRTPARPAVLSSALCAAKRALDMEMYIRYVRATSRVVLLF